MKLLLSVLSSKLEMFVFLSNISCLSQRIVDAYIVYFFLSLIGVCVCVCVESYHNKRKVNFLRLREKLQI